MGNIIIKDLDVWYGKINALRKINLKIPDRAITAIIGPSGCGKTTLLRSINRLTDHIPDCTSKGQIFLDDVDILTKQFDALFLRQNVGMLFQKPTPFPFTILENMIIPLKIRGKNNLAEMKEMAFKYLEIVGLCDELKGRIETSTGLDLSVGQQQRLCLARALITNPKVLLLDEPCSALDPLSTHHIEDLLKTLSNKINVIIVTHSLAQAKRISDQACFILDGKLIEVGETQQIFTDPKDERTSNYVIGNYG